MKLPAVLILTASLLAAHAGAAAALNPPHDEECAVICEHEQPKTAAAEDACCPSSAAAATPAGPVATPPAQPAVIASPGNKFPLPAPVRQETAAAQRTGTIAIRAVQGTEGGEAIRSVPIEIELYHRGMLLDTVKAELDEHGVALVEDLPVAMGLQPLVKVFYSGVTYQKVGNLMDAQRNQQMVEIVCYELTEEEPAWKLGMRHVMVSLAPDGVQVTEVVLVNNPTDRTWIGIPQAEGKAITTQFVLPESASSVMLGDGFHDWCCTTEREARLLNHLPLTPGSTEMIYAYFLPARRGSVAVDITAPAQIDHLMVLIPDDLKTASYTGLVAAGVNTMGERPLRMYTGVQMEPGRTAQIVLTGLAPTEAMSAGWIAKALAAVGGGAILLVAAFLIFAKSPKTGRPVAAPATN
jgi:hypothetical protein